MKEEIKANQKIREAMKESGFLYWKLADLIGCSNWTLSVKLRHELPEAEQERILQLIRMESERLRKG